jgi:hypothetical protein
MVELGQKRSVIMENVVVKKSESEATIGDVGVLDYTEDKRETVFVTKGKFRDKFPFFGHFIHHRRVKNTVRFVCFEVPIVAHSNEVTTVNFAIKNSANGVFPSKCMNNGERTGPLPQKVGMLSL